MNHVSVLQSLGFKKFGSYRLLDAACAFGELEPFDNTDTIYVFVHDGRVMYVGSADEPRSRLGHYSRAFSNEQKNRPVHVGFRTLNNTAIDIYLRRMESTVAMADGLPVGMLLGVEAGLIILFDPPWNGRGKKPIVVSETSPSKAETAALASLIQSTKIT